MSCQSHEGHEVDWARVWRSSRTLPKVDLLCGSYGSQLDREGLKRVILFVSLPVTSQLCRYAKC